MITVFILAQKGKMSPEGTIVTRELSSTPFFETLRNPSNNHELTHLTLSTSGSYYKPVMRKKIEKIKIRYYTIKGKDFDMNKLFFL